jgi:hypothetical protein
MNGASRFTVGSVDDEDELMQRVKKAEGIDSPEDFERIQNYGFTSTLLDQDEEDKQQQKPQQSQDNQSGGYGGQKPNWGQDQKKKGKGPEAAVIYQNGDRSHPLMVAADDRRHRPYSIPKGGSAQYDQHGQMTYLKPSGENPGVFMIATDYDDSQSSGGGGGASAGTLAAGGGKAPERMASLRHVDKEKQTRKLKNKGGPVQSAQSGGQQQGGAQTQQGGQQQQKKEFKHEGEDDKINHEVRVTKKRIEFRSGNKVVGYYDKGEDKWYFTGKVIFNEATEQVKDKAPKIDHN